MRPLVIDYFLGWNEQLQPLGKLLIAAAILECEAHFKKLNGNRNHILNAQRSAVETSTNINVSKIRESWCRFIVHKLVSDCKTSEDLLQNKVRFITFNYDTSLEWQLWSSLRSMEFLREKDVKEFLSGDRVMHVYGAVRADPLSVNGLIDLESIGAFIRGINEGRAIAAQLKPVTDLLDKFMLAGASLLTIDPHDKERDAVTDACNNLFVEAQDAYVLGYGFDRNNNRRIRLANLAGPGRSRRIYFTNFGNINSVNKRVSQLIGDGENFVDGASTVQRYDSVFERSSRNVYEALELDFGLV